MKEKEQLVISLYYVEELNMRQIADILEISEPRVSQIHSNAIKKLKKSCGILRQKRVERKRRICFRDFMIWQQI